MEVRLGQLPQRLLLLAVAAFAASSLETADLVDLCGQTWQGAGLLLRSHPASRRFYFVAPDTDCGLWMRAAAAGDRIRFQFRFFLVYSLAAAAPEPNASSLAPADPCAPGSYLQFYEGPPGAPRPLGAPLCGLTIPPAVVSSGPFLGLRLLTRGRQPRVDFVGEATSFRLGSCGAYFRCRNGRCVPPSLVCDRWGVDNCGDGSDQASWPPADCRGSPRVPSQAGSTDGPTSKPLMLPPALSSAGALQMAAPRTPVAGQAPEQQGTAVPPGDPRLRGVALVCSLVLASAGLLVGLLWCCCSSRWRAWWAGAHGLCPTRVLARGLLGGHSRVRWPSRVREELPRGCGFRNRRVGSGLRQTEGSTPSPGGPPDLGHVAKASDSVCSSHASWVS